MVDHQQIEQQHDQSLHSASGDDDKSVDGKSVPSASHASHSSHGHAKKATAGSKKIAHHPKKKINHSQKHPHAEQHHDSHDHADTSSSVHSTAGSHTNSKNAGTVIHGLPEGAEVHEALRDLSVEEIVSHVQRARTQEAVEAQLRAEAEIEIKRRVKQALTAAANKDYSGFALAVGSKSPHSRQTFAKYTGRPVSQGSQNGLSININGSEFSATSTAANTARGTDASRNVSFLASAVPEEPTDVRAPSQVVDTIPKPTGGVEISSAAQEVSKAPEPNVLPAVELSNSQSSHNVGYAVPPPLVFETPENTYSTTQHIQYHAQQGPSPSVKPAALSSLSVLSTMEERRSNAASFRQSARSSDGTVATLRDLPEDNFEPDSQARPEEHDDAQYDQNAREVHLSTVGGSLDTNSQWGARLPSQSMLDGSIDMMEPFAASALLARQGGPPPHAKMLMDDSNLSESYIRSMMEQQQRSSMKASSEDNKHPRERRISTVVDDDDVESKDFRQFAATELQHEKEKRLSMGADGSAMPSRVELFNQIFETTKDMKKLEMIRIHAPEAAKMVDSSTCTAQDKMGFPAEAKDTQTASQLLLSSWADASASEVLLPGRAPPGQSSAENDTRNAGMPKAFSAAEIQRIKEALKGVVDADTWSYLLTQLQSISNAVTERKHGGGHELQIYDNQADLLVTRTYREPTPAASFYELLSSSTNPLLHLHQEYASFLSKTHRVRLLNAAVMEDRIKLDLPQSKAIQTLLSLLLEAMLSTVAECNEMLSLVKHCENRVVSMVDLLKRKPDYLGAVQASPQLAEVYRCVFLFVCCLYFYCFVAEPSICCSHYAYHSSFHDFAVHMARSKHWRFPLV